MMKKLMHAAAVLALSATAHAANLQITQLPGLPASPVSAPSIRLPQAVILPSIMPAQPVALPAVERRPLIAPSLPTLPTPVITIPGRPAIHLPGPANPIPVRPVATLDGVKSVAQATAQPKDETPAQRQERLERLYDGSGRPRGDDSRHTLPESDLLGEIGISHIE